MLTFVIDVSVFNGYRKSVRIGVKDALTLLVEQLRPRDKVGYCRLQYPRRGSSFRIPALRDVRGSWRQSIRLSQRIRPNVDAGLRLGYDLALRNAKIGGINRVILCSDGVANVDATDPGVILRKVRGHVAEGDYADNNRGSAWGNFNDVLLEQLADNGNGSYAYVDTLNEAKRVFVENLTGTLQLIAKDAKIQVDFNPRVVSRFRLLGYENRRLDHAEFRDDRADGGEIGSGHSVTALYEINLREGGRGHLATVSIRYEGPRYPPYIRNQQGNFYNNN